MMACAALMWGAGCREPLTPQQEAARTREASARCQGNSTDDCIEACHSGGPNVTCSRACEASDGESCEQLAARLEREIDVPDPEAPPRSIAPVDEERATEAHERACQLGFKQGCRLAAARILNGQGRGKRPASAVTDLLKRGCDDLQDADSCCAMAQLNFRLGQGRAGPRNLTDDLRPLTLARHAGSCGRPDRRGPLGSSSVTRGVTTVAVRRAGRRTAPGRCCRG